MFKNVSSGAAILTLLLTSGCLIESTIDANGGGTMLVSYKLKDDAEAKTVPANMTSAYIEGIDAKKDADGIGHFRLKVKDFRKLSTAKFFSDAEVTRTVDAEKGTTTIQAKIKREKPKTIPDAAKKLLGDQVKFVTTVPGEITETNATSKEAKTATWVFTMDEFFGKTEVPLTLTYKNPS